MTHNSPFVIAVNPARVAADNAGGFVQDLTLVSSNLQQCSERRLKKNGLARRIVEWLRCESHRWVKSRVVLSSALTAFLLCFQTESWHPLSAPPSLFYEPSGFLPQWFWAFLLGLAALAPLVCKLLGAGCHVAAVKFSGAIWSAFWMTLLLTGHISFGWVLCPLVLLDITVLGLKDTLPCDSP